MHSVSALLPLVPLVAAGAQAATTFGSSKPGGYCTIPPNSSTRGMFMEFCIQLSAYYPDKSYGGDRIYADMLEQARVADRCG